MRSLTKKSQLAPTELSVSKKLQMTLPLSQHSKKGSRWSSTAASLTPHEPQTHQQKDKMFKGCC